MNIEESIQQIETLIEAWQLDEADLNQTDINAMQTLLKENEELKEQNKKEFADYIKFKKEQHDEYLEKVNKLIKEKQELKKQLEERPKEYVFIGNAQNKTRDFINQIVKENEGLKKQLENNLKINVADHKYASTCEDKVIILETQQKEFINYLEDEIDICDGFLDTVKSDLRDTPYEVMSSNKTYITTRIKENEIAQKVYKEILQKYKEIIGDDK